MEAGETEHGVSTPVPDIEEFRAIPEGIMRSSQITALDPEAQEGQDPSYKWTDGHRPLMDQAKVLRDMSDHMPANMAIFFKKDSSAVERGQEILLAEARDTPDQQEAVTQSLKDRLSRTIAASELLPCAAQEELLDKTSKLDSRVEAELQPELMSLTLAVNKEKEEEETAPDTSTPRGFWPPCKTHPGETDRTESRQGKQLQSEATQENQGQEGFLQPQEARGLEGQEGQEEELQEEGTRNEDICFGGLLGEQEEVEEGFNGNEEEQKQEQIQNYMLGGGQWGSEGLGGKLEGLNYSERGQENRERRVWVQRDSEEEGQDQELGEVGERRVATQYAENQRLGEKSANVRRKQEDHDQTERVMPVGEQKDAVDSGDRERGARESGGQTAVEGSRPGEDRKPCLPMTSVASEVVSPNTLFQGMSSSVADSPQIQREPVPEEPTPQVPALEPTEWSHPPIPPPASFAPEESLDNRTHNSLQEEARLRKVISTKTSVAPAGTPDSPPFTPPNVFSSTATLSPVSSSVTLPEKETLAASVSADTPFHCGLSETPPLPAKSFRDPCATCNTASPHSPLSSYIGVTQHLRSNSFPGSHRTEQTPDSLGMSLSFSHLELPQRLPKQGIYGSLIPRRNRSRDGIIFSESSTALFPLKQDCEEFSSNPGRPSTPHGSQPWSSPQNSAFAIGSPANVSSLPTVSMDTIHEALPPPPPEKRHSYSNIVERDDFLHAVAPTLKRHSHPPPLTLSSGLHRSSDSIVPRQYRPLPSTPESPHHTQTSIPSRQRYNKPLPPTPDMPDFCRSSISSSNISRIYKPLPPVPIINLSFEPPPLPPKSRGRSRSVQGGIIHSGGQAKPRPTSQDWTLSVGRTSWPPATGRSTESLPPSTRCNSEVSPGLAFSNMTNLLSPSSPTTPWIPELQRPTSKEESGLTEESEPPVRGSFRRSAPQEEFNNTRRSALRSRKESEKPIHYQLEKASSWPHRRDSAITSESGSGEVVLGQAPNKHKGWSRQGLRRPSILPEGSSGK